jgi:hypothetical protein
MTKLVRAIVKGREQGRWLLFRWAAILYATGTLLHTLDHLRRGTDVISREVFWGGNISTPIAVLIIFLALAGYRHAPVLAVAFGFPHAIGIAVVHLLPDWGAFSDSLTTNAASAISFLAVMSEILGAALFGAAGLYVLLGERTGTPRNSMLTSG